MHAGEFELHLTGSEWQVEELAAFARAHQVKFSHIELHGGKVWSQPMLTIGARGTIDEVRAVAGQWRARMHEADLFVVRVKVEAAPWNEGVPQTDEEADAALYFEHHVKLRLPEGDWYTELYRAAAPHEAHISRNARRTRADGSEERFVTQRCFGVGRVTAKRRLDALLAALHAFEVVEVEEEYVVDDDALHIDDGWIGGPGNWHRDRDERVRRAPAGQEGFPSTYRPLAVKPGQQIRQRAVFDPALKHFSNAFRGGDPKFADPSDGARWLAARRRAMAEVLRIVGTSRWSANLVLRGSVLMREWFGAAAREPGDLDFVVTPRDIRFGSPRAGELVDDLRAAVGPSVVESIWTYERVPGLRVVFPFEAGGLPDGAVQVDLVFEEDLPIAPEPVRIAGTTLLAASRELSLAWKVQWLATDMWPQAKDLYDAALLAGHTTVDTAVVRELIRPEWGHGTDGFGPESVARLGDVDWENAPSELPVTKADEPALLRRIAAALR
ncbi:nucleotidyl transferase AbiEii/AbiGii toxin family protein [Lentzea sp. CC55]|uniref:nucleotidyl transferase AbiEii/AbiGii toxin family protein n=1 Tax=Lentzea sp. CC55 TaxID=2884909 RepID=UPI0027DF0670|nr:nucleotidyl transferase AbiEii/AbiGii toxin family protein [Lentzea sp. CC55]MCG8927935.1 nucleotidyl transferase AbiEii/AbiGii toxin family protein [Lentzea sp. CC55]